MNRRGRDERGTVTVWLTLSSVLMVTIIGITVDFGGYLHAQQRARTIASQAARTGGEQISATAVTGARPTVDPIQARNAARAYLRAVDVQGTVTITAGGTRLAVETTVHYTPLFLGVAGVGELTATGTSTAQLTRFALGEER